MLLIALLLGAAFAWIVEILWTEFRGGYDKKDAFPDKLRRRSLDTLIFLLLLGVGAIYVLGIYGRFFAGDWSSRYVVALHYMTAPSVLGGIVAFVAGAALVFWRDQVKLLWNWFKERFLEGPQAPRAPLSPPAAPLSPPAPPLSPPAPGPAAAAAASTQAADRAQEREPYPWLTRIVGIAAVTLVATITLVLFFPDILARVESIKVAGVEARFAQAASRSVQIVAQNQEKMATNHILDSWAGYGQHMAGIVKNTQELVGKRQTAADRIESDDIRKHADRFLVNIAVPLAAAIQCHADDFEVRDTKIQHKAVTVASLWGRVFRATSEPKLPNADEEAKRVADNEKRLERAVASSYELIREIDEDRENRIAKCEGKGSLAHVSRDDISELVMEIAYQLKPHIAKIRSDGYAVAFVGQFYLLTHTLPQAVMFMDDMGKGLDQSPGNLAAQIKFYRERANARYVARVPFSYIDGDLGRTRDSVNKAIGLIEDAEETLRTGNVPTGTIADEAAKLQQLADYYKLRRVLVLNNQLDLLIGEWLSGRRLLPSELVFLEGAPVGGAAYEISQWLKQQSLTWLGDRHRNGDPSAKGALENVAGLNDTLAMRELVLGANKNDLTRDRCSRIAPLLATARTIYKELSDNDSQQLVTAHHNLYESKCSQ